MIRQTKRFLSYILSTMLVIGLLPLGVGAAPLTSFTVHLATHDKDAVANAAYLRLELPAALNTFADNSQIFLTFEEASLEFHANFDHTDVRIFTDDNEVGGATSHSVAAVAAAGTFVVARDEDNVLRIDLPNDNVAESPAHTFMYIALGDFVGLSGLDAATLLDEPYNWPRDGENALTNGTAGFLSLEPAEGVIDADSYTLIVNGNTNLTGSAAFALNDEDEIDIEVQVQANLLTFDVNYVAGANVDLGELLLSETSILAGATFAVETNSPSGYQILASTTELQDDADPANTISAKADAGAVTPGTQGWGFNLIENAGEIGADPTLGDASVEIGYKTVDEYKAEVGDDVLATTAAAAAVNTYTITYAVAIDGTVPAGTYTATQTLKAVASF